MSEGKRVGEKCREAIVCGCIVCIGKRVVWQEWEEKCLEAIVCGGKRVGIERSGRKNAGRQ